MVTYQVCVHLMALATMLGLAATAPPLFVRLSDLFFWLTVGLACHATQLETTSSTGNRLRVSIGFASSVACIVLFPPVLAAPLVALNSLSWRDITRRTTWYKVLFNRSMFAISAAAGAFSFRSFEALQPGDPIWFITSAMTGGLIYYGANTLLVTFVLAYASRRHPRYVWHTTASLTSHVCYVTLAATGTALALAYQSNGPLAVMVLGIPLVTSYYALRNAWSARQIQHFARQLQRFVSPMTTRTIREGSDALPGTGELREFAILFSDMRGFTSYADRLNPDLVFRLLSSSLALQTDIVIKHNGNLDKIYGDGFLAYFDGPHKVQNALACALEIRDRVRTAPIEDGATKLPVGLAVHVGQVLFGFLGTRDRVDHTVAGDVVNTCHRMCDIAKPFQVVTTQAAKDELGNTDWVSFSSMGTMQLRGKSTSVTLFDVEGTPKTRDIPALPTPAGRLIPIVP